MPSLFHAVRRFGIPVGLGLICLLALAPLLTVGFVGDDILSSFTRGGVQYEHVPLLTVILLRSA